MSREPSDREFEAVLNMPPEKRYRHFVEQIVDSDHVWMAESDDGILTFNSRRGGEILPVWPARRYAEHVLRENFPDARFFAMTVRDWLEETLRPLEEDDEFELAIFPDSDGYGCQATCADLIADIEAELETRIEALLDIDSVMPETARDDRMEAAMKLFLEAKPEGKPH